LIKNAVKKTNKSVTIQRNALRLSGPAIKAGRDPTESAAEQSSVIGRRRPQKVIFIRIDDAEIGWNAGIKETDFFASNERQKLLDLVIAGDEFNRDAGASCQLEETLLVHRMVSPEAADGAKSAAAANAEGIGFFQQPLPQQNALMALLLSKIKPEQ